MKRILIVLFSVFALVPAMAQAKVDLQLDGFTTGYIDGFGTMSIEKVDAGRFRVLHDRNICTFNAQGKSTGCTKMMFFPEIVGFTVVTLKPHEELELKLHTSEEPITIKIMQPYVGKPSLAVQVGASTLALFPMVRFY